MTYSNGRLPDSELRAVPWQSRERVHKDIYASVVAFGNAFKARFGYFPVITDSYRDYDEQVRMYATLGYPKAARPGTSNHGLGRAIDWSSSINVYGSAQWNFMNTVGRTFGMRPLNENNKKFEPWHWQNLTSTVSNPGFDVPDIPEITVPNTPEPLEEDMALTEAEYQRLKGDMQATANSAVTALIPAIAAAVANAVWRESFIARPTPDHTDRVAAIQELADTRTWVEAISAASGVDPAAITSAAEAGTRKALESLTLKSV